MCTSTDLFVPFIMIFSIVRLIYLRSKWSDNGNMLQQHIRIVSIHIKVEIPYYSLIKQKKFTNM